MAPPNNLKDLKQISDTVNALQMLSYEQLISVEHSVSEQKINSQKAKKLDAVYDKRVKLEGLSQSKLFDLDRKIDSNRQLYSLKLETLLKDSVKDIKSKPINISPNTNNLLSKLNPTQTVPEDTTDAFLKKADEKAEQIELLKSINEKIGKLSGNGGKSSGIIGKIVDSLPQIIMAVAEAKNGAAGLGALGTAAKILNIPAPTTFAKGASKVGGVAKSGIGLLGKVAKYSKGSRIIQGAALGALAYGGYKALSDDSEEVEQREKGGLVSKNTPYVVGEKGPELFMPSGNGSIIPNNLISNKSLSENNDAIMSSVATLLSNFAKPFDKTTKLFGRENNIKYTSFYDSFIAGLSGLKERVLAMIPRFPSFGGDETNNGGANNTPPTPATDTGTANQPSPRNVQDANAKRNSLGDYNVESTGIRKLHQDEMVLPKNQAEMVRAASELKNDYRISSAKSDNGISKRLDESFWMKKFVPAFAEAIKVDKKPSQSSYLSNVANPFG
jgi:hypothetical protein